MDEFEAECNRQGGIWHGKTIGCILNEKREGIEFLRLVYPSTEVECKKNGDMWTRFGNSNILVCRELFLDEYCEKKGYNDITGCLGSIQLPYKKIEKYISGPLRTSIYLTQTLPLSILEKEVRCIAKNKYDADQDATIHSFLNKQVLNEEMINHLIKNWGAVGDMYFKPLEYLAHYQKFSTKNIQKYVETVYQDSNSFNAFYERYHDVLSRKQIMYLIDNNKRVDLLVQHVKQLEPEHITGLLQKTAVLAEPTIVKRIVDRHKLDDDQVGILLGYLGYGSDEIANRVIDTQSLSEPRIMQILKSGSTGCKNHLLRSKYLSKSIVDWCLAELHHEFWGSLYEGQHRRLSDKQKSEVLWILLSHGYFTTMQNPTNVFPHSMLDKYLDMIYGQEFGGRKQVSLEKYVTGLSVGDGDAERFREYYIRYGRDPEHPILHKLYEHIQLSPEQIDKALEIGYSVEQLFHYQKNLEPRHIDYAIRNNINLDNLVTSDRITPVQRKAILKKMGFGEKELEQLGDIVNHPLWKHVSPRRLMTAVRLYKDSIEKRMPQAPLRGVVGRYPRDEHPLEPIIVFLKKKRMHLKKGDLRYAYYVDKDGHERRIRVGKLVQRDRNLYTIWRHLMQYGVPSFEKSDLEILISDNPEDIAAKSTGWSATGKFPGSCETIGSSYGWGDTCGWCDDIKANNLIAIVKKKDEPGRKGWLGRSMIRWCVRDDDKEIDAVMDKYYGDQQYKPVLVKRLKNILERYGFSGEPEGSGSCVTPYKYSGYVDTPASGAGHYPYERAQQKIYYAVSPRPFRGA